jgi:hypothetical protein
VRACGRKATYGQPMRFCDEAMVGARFGHIAFMFGRHSGRWWPDDPAALYRVTTG